MTKLTTRSKITGAGLRPRPIWAYGGTPTKWRTSPGKLMGLRQAAAFPRELSRRIGEGLELSNPDEVLSRFGPFPADTIIVQWNTLTHPLETFKDIRSRNAKVGLGLNPDDHIGDVARFFRNLYLLLILGVYPGFGGRAMQPGTAKKIGAARAIARDLNPSLAIAVDGGVKRENPASLVEAGADCLIMGTALFQSHDLKQTISEIRESLAVSPRR